MSANRVIGKTIGYAVAGGIVGLLCGLMFAYAISLVGSFVVLSKAREIQETLAVFGMIGGSVIGSIFGGLIGMRE